MGPIQGHAHNNIVHWQTLNTSNPCELQVLTATSDRDATSRGAALRQN